MRSKRNTNRKRKSLLSKDTYDVIVICRQNEIFREEEVKLRQKDLDIQGGMIKFSTFLQDNEKKKKKAD